MLAGASLRSLMELALPPNETIVVPPAPAAILTEAANVPAVMPRPLISNRSLLPAAPAWAVKSVMVSWPNPARSKRLPTTAALVLQRYR